MPSDENATPDRESDAAFLESPARFRLGWVSLMAAGIGAAAAVAAFLIYNVINLFTNLVFYGRFSFVFATPPNEPQLAFLIIPAVGGLIVGVMAKYGTPQIIGHGIPEAMEAVWSKRSRIRARIMILKPLSAAVAIGTGAPFGVEGPIIQTGGSMGSVLGQGLGTTAAERKVLLGCGAAAGMAATFNTPLAGVLLAIELLLFEFKSRSFIPLGIATVIATGLRAPLLGSGSLIEMPTGVNIHFLPDLPYLLALGGILGGAAVLFKRGFFWTEDQFEKIPADNMWLPAIGGLLLGVIGYFVPLAMGVGYETATAILSGEYTLSFLIILALAKSAALYVSLGSKTSGGLLAPMFVVGGAIGAAFAMAINTVIPGAAVPAGVFALAGMGVLFGVSARATFAFILFPVEVTGQFEALLPIFLVAVIADGVATLFLGHSIMTEKLVRKGVNISTDYEVDVLKRYTVGDVMDQEPATVPPEATVKQLTSDLASSEHEIIRNGTATEHDAFPIVTDEGKLVGIVTHGDLIEALTRGKAERTALEVGTKNLISGHADEQLYDAVVTMSVHGVEQLPIVDAEAPSRLVGFLEASDAMASALRRLEAEHLRDQRKLASGRRSWI